MTCNTCCMNSLELKSGEMTPTSCPQKLPESGNSLAPWVQICFEDGDSKITVSNNSSPQTAPKNVAAIQGFEMGQSDGMTVRVTIQDQHGGRFHDFMDHLFKNWSCLTAKASAKAGSTTASGTASVQTSNAFNNRMYFQFGWVKDGCVRPSEPSLSHCYYVTMTEVETTFSDGKFTAEITGRDSGSSMMEGAAETVQGGDSEAEAMCLKDAIKYLLVDSEQGPSVGNVRFLTMMSGYPTDIGFEYCDPKCDCTYMGNDYEVRKSLPEIAPGTEPSHNRGPRLKWNAAGRNKLQAAFAWMKGWRTQNKKGWTCAINPSCAEQEIIFWEDRNPRCLSKGDGYWDPTCIGTYIVNGGKQSPVLEFNPKIGWNFSMMTSTGGASSSESSHPIPEDPSIGSEGDKRLLVEKNNRVQDIHSK